MYKLALEFKLGMNAGCTLQNMCTTLFIVVSAEFAAIILNSKSALAFNYQHIRSLMIKQHINNFGKSTHRH